MIKLKLAGGAEVWVDFDLDKSRCKGCRKRIYWATTCNAKKMPIIQNDDGQWQSHFYDCRKAAMFRREYKPNTDGVGTDTKWLKKI